MNIEFHYYALRYLCKNAGFPGEDASTIAISSQLVDECTAPWEVFGKGRGAFTQITQNYVFWDEKVAQDIYRPFHFIPGDGELAGSRRKDGRPGRYVVTEDSGLAREILIVALKTHDLFRIGIALHAYADTWAHQNFSSNQEDQNALEPSSLIPAVGHLPAFRKPDIPRLVWHDTRLKEPFQEVHNADRFSRAATMIYRFLCTYNRKGFADEPFVVGKLEELWRNKEGADDGAARASDYIVDFDVPPYERDAWALRAGGAASGLMQGASDFQYSGYSRFSWLKTAASKAQSALGSLRGTIPETTYSGSLFERWNKAAADHKAFCGQLFAQRGIE